MRKIFSLFLQVLLMAVVAMYSASCERMIFESEGDCPPEIVEPEPGPDPFRISVRTNMDGAGTANVSGESASAETDGEYYVSIAVTPDEAYTLTATANTGYTFIGWHDDTNDILLPVGVAVIGNLKSESATKYTAIFNKGVESEPEPEPGKISISVRVMPVAGAGTSQVASASDSAGTDGTYPVTIVISENEPYTLTAIESNPGYAFFAWYDETHKAYLTEKEKVFEDLKSEVSVSYVAIFVKIEDPTDPEPEPDPEKIRISVRTNISGAGTAKVHEFADATNAKDTDEAYYVSIVVVEDTDYVLTATANSGYVFVRWHDDTNDVLLPAGEATLRLTSEEPTKYTAIFERVAVVDPTPDPTPGPTPDPTPENILISVRVDLEGAGIATVYENENQTNKVEAAGTRFESIVVKAGDKYTLNARCNEGYTFTGWYDETNYRYVTTMEMTVELESTVNTQYTATYKKNAEPEPGVKYYVEFVYDMNMKFADAFYSQVKSVYLYVFQNSQLVQTYKESGDILKNRNYRMELIDLEPGTYEFIAWCGLENNNDFEIANVAKNTDATVTLLRTTNGVSKNNLMPVFHGRVEEPLPANNEHTVTIHLTKDTNNINLSLTQLGDAGMKEGQFKVRMKGGMYGAMNYMNDPAGNLVEFTPWDTEYRSLTINGKQPAGAYNYMRTEISTTRLMADKNPIIEIVDVLTDPTNEKVVFSIPFVEWAKAFRSANHKNMRDQEYLDREDEYNIMLYIENSKQGWIATEIVINDWSVRDNGTANL